MLGFHDYSRTTFSCSYAFRVLEWPYLTHPTERVAREGEVVELTINNLQFPRVFVRFISPDETVFEALPACNESLFPLFE